MNNKKYIGEVPTHFREPLFTGSTIRTTGSPLLIKKGGIYNVTISADRNSSRDEIYCAAYNSRWGKVKEISHENLCARESRTDKYRPPISIDEAEKICQAAAKQFAQDTAKANNLELIIE